MARVRSFDLYAGLGSDVTSAVFNVGDARLLTLQMDIASISTTTVQGSNVTGFRSAIAEGDWSTLTTVISNTDQFLNIEPGFKWIRCSRSSNVMSRAILGMLGTY